jgi:hypothetical protein
MTLLRVPIRIRIATTRTPFEATQEAERRAARKPRVLIGRLAMSANPAVALLRAAPSPIPDMDHLMVHF